VDPVAVVQTSGRVVDPEALVHPGSGGLTTLDHLPEFGLHDRGPDSWPTGTVATASSTYPDGSTFAPSKALDGNPDTYWNNAHAGSTDSWLEITTPAPVKLSAVTLLFDHNGVPVDFALQTWSPASSSWVDQVTITGNAAVERAVRFPAPVTTRHLRIRITLDQATPFGQFSRVAEVYPFYDPPAKLVLDYGRDVGGIPEFDVARQQGSPIMQVGYSEGLQYLSAFGDTAVSPPLADPHRYDVYQVDRAGVIVNRYIQGGERYEEIVLDSTPGSVTLSQVWIHFEPFLGTPARLRGYFVSSSSVLNRVWYDGAYTASLVEVRRHTPAGYWTVERGHLSAMGGGTGLVRAGEAWTNYTMSFETKLVALQSGWVVHAQSPSTKYLLILDAENDTQGPPDSLQEVVENAGTYRLIARVALPFEVQLGTWYSVRTTVSGSVVTTALDGQVVGSFTSADLPAGATPLPSGSVGFREYTGDGEAADFRDLVVGSATGVPLFESTLAVPADLDAFSVPGENQASVVVDGAKRDRVVWEGDFLQTGPTIYYSYDNTSYLRNSLQLLGSYQLQSGFVRGDIPPNAPVNTMGLLPGEVGTYSATYSIDFVINLAKYFLYTGNRTFVREEMPTVERELAWNESQLNSQGLLVTNAADGLDWDYYDGEKVGAVTAYNELYYEALRGGSELAAGVGDVKLAKRYASQAASLRAAINRYLFDPMTGSYYVAEPPVIGPAQLTPPPAGASADAPVISAAGPGTVIGGETVTLTGRNFGSAQGSSYVHFYDDGTNWGTPVDVAPFSIVSWSSDRIVFRVPPGGTSGYHVVPGTEAFVSIRTAAGKSNAAALSIVSPWAGVAQDADSYALLFGVAPRRWDARLVRSMQTTLWKTPYGPLSFSPAVGYAAYVSPFASGFEVQGLLAVHDTADALTLVKRLWGYMDASGPDDTAADWEVLSTSGEPGFGGFTSLAHGWSTGPTSALSEYVMGAAPVGAGYRTWVVDPHPGSLAWVEGDAPTPYGDLNVKWGHETASGRFVMEVGAPQGTTGTIDVPTFGKNVVVHVNGHLVWSNGVFHPAPGVTAAHAGDRRVDLEVDPAQLLGPPGPGHTKSSDEFVVSAKEMPGPPTPPTLPAHLPAPTSPAPTPSVPPTPPTLPAHLPAPTSPAPTPSVPPTPPVTPPASTGPHR